MQSVPAVLAREERARACSVRARARWRVVAPMATRPPQFATLGQRPGKENPRPALKVNNLELPFMLESPYKHFELLVRLLSIEKKLKRDSKAYIVSFNQ